MNNLGKPILVYQAEVQAQDLQRSLALEMAAFQASFFDFGEPSEK